MNDKLDGALPGMERICEIEGILDCYPDVSADQIQTLKHWFNHEASAYEVGVVASNTLIAEGYRKFRTDHIDRLTMLDAAKATGLVLVPVLATVAFFLLR